MTTFQDLGLSAEILQALPELGIETPSEIQERAIPLLLGEYTDFIGLAQTGTGKTAAFGLPLLDAIDINQRHTQALVLAPTRELGQQIAEQFSAFSKYKKGLECLAVYGGASIQGQMKDLKRVKQVIIATPGRLIDLVKRNAIDLSQITHLVLDEADEMLNMGFKDELDEILSFTPQEKVTWLFSATMGGDIRRIVNQYMEAPKEVRVGKKDEVNKNITHQFAFLKASDKQDALRRFIDLEPDMRGIIFCRTKMDTQTLAADLRKLGYAIDAIHGDLTQNQRDKVMGLFKTHTINLLAATDVAARGIDVKDITHVIHYALPDDPEYYTHRSGRTARAGQRGTSLALVSKRDLSKVKSLEKGLKINFDKVLIPLAADIQQARISQWAVNLTSAKSEAEVPAELIEQVESLFASLSEEEIIQKLISMEMAKIGTRTDSHDLNEKDRGRQAKGEGKKGDQGRRDPRSDRRSDRNDKRERPEGRRSRGELKGDKFDRKESKPSGDMVRFMVNVGKKERVNKANFLQFICSESGLSKRQIGTIDIQAKRSYFEVPASEAKSLPSKFKDIEVNGRLLKVVRG